MPITVRIVLELRHGIEVEVHREGHAAIAVRKAIG